MFINDGFTNSDLVFPPIYEKKAQSKTTLKRLQIEVILLDDVFDDLPFDESI